MTKISSMTLIIKTITKLTEQNKNLFKITNTLDPSDNKK